MDPTSLQYPSCEPSFIDSPHTSSWLNSETFGKYNWCTIVVDFVRSAEVEVLIRKNLEIDRPALASFREMDGNHYVSSSYHFQRTMFIVTQLPVTKPNELASEIVQILLKPKGTVLEKLWISRILMKWLDLDSVSPVSALWSIDSYRTLRKRAYSLKLKNCRDLSMHRAGSWLAKDCTSTHSRGNPVY